MPYQFRVGRSGVGLIRLVGVPPRTTRLGKVVTADVLPAGLAFGPPALGGHGGAVAVAPASASSVPVLGASARATPRAVASAGGRPSGSSVINDQVDEKEGDGYEDEVNGFLCSTSVYHLTRSHSNISYRKWTAYRFLNGPFPPRGSRVTVAYAEVNVVTETYDDFNCDIYAEKAAAPGGMIDLDYYNITSRPRTDASIPWVEDSLGTGWVRSPSLVDIIQEVVDAYTVGPLVLILKPRTNVDKMCWVWCWDEDSHVLGMKLHLEWEVPSAYEVLAPGSGQIKEIPVPSAASTPTPKAQAEATPSRQADALSFSETQTVGQGLAGAEAEEAKRGVAGEEGWP